MILALWLACSLNAESSLRNDVGQLFIGFLYGDTVGAPQRAFLERSRLGNIIYFQWANTLESPEQVATLSQQLDRTIYQITRARPLIAVDQEGGPVARLKTGFTAFTSQEVMGQLDDPCLVYRRGRTIAQELRRVGITMNLAPVVDVNVCPENPVIGSRSFGANPQKVVRLASEFLRAHREVGVATVLKHFPGHGDTRTNSHLALPTVDKPMEALEETELFPFRSLTYQADAIMTAHLRVPALDSVEPATFSYRILTRLLRESMGFEGVIMSDSLAMRAAVPQQATFDEAVEGMTRAAIRAFLAGCDCLLLGALDWADCSVTPADNIRMQERVMDGFLEAVETGEIPQSRVKASLARIQQLKRFVHTD
jgi:beta-N-acetylhexosaminidase